MPEEQAVKLGGCQCGAVRFSSAGEPLALYACHCRECQKQSASAFGLSLQVARSGLTILAGQPEAWTRSTDSGGRLTCRFCGACGSRLWHEATPTSETVTLKAGCLDDPPDLTGAVHIWTARKLKGVVIPNAAVQFSGEPPD